MLSNDVFFRCSSHTATDMIAAQSPGHHGAQLQQQCIKLALLTAACCAVHCAGSAAYGFWYRMLTNPEGPSTTTTSCPKFTPLAAFKDNVAHSNMFYGLRIFPEYYPKVNPCDSSYNQLPAVFDGLVSYKNGMKCAIATQVRRRGMTAYWSCKHATLDQGYDLLFGTVCWGQVYICMQPLSHLIHALEPPPPSLLWLPLRWGWSSSATSRWQTAARGPRSMW
jgi:hypothetical protein